MSVAARRACLLLMSVVVASAVAGHRELSDVCMHSDGEDASLLQLRQGQMPCMVPGCVPCAQPRVLVVPMPVPLPVPVLRPMDVTVLVPAVPTPAPSTTTQSVVVLPNELPDVPEVTPCETPPKSCDMPCIHDVDQKGEGSVTCRDRVNWVKDHSPLFKPGALLQGAIDLVKTECMCQCACDIVDFPVIEPLPAPLPSQCETPARSCDSPCMWDVDQKGEGVVTCRDRVNWAKDHSPLVQPGDLSGAIALIKNECACQCACEIMDFPVIEPLPEPMPSQCKTPAKSCDSPCVWDVDQKGEGVVTCRDRVKWAKDHSPLVQPGDLSGAIALIKQECSCQCMCEISDF